MLDPWIIEEILKREEEHRREEERVHIEVPLVPRYQEGEPTHPSNQEEEGNRGVIVIDI